MAEKNLRMRTRRRELGLSVDKAARAAGIGYRQWVAIERGDRQPSLPTARKIALVLQSSLDDLFLHNTTTVSGTQ